MAERKVFSRRDVLVAAAPHLFGHSAEILERVADRVLADPTAIRLLGVPGAKEPAYAPACVIAVEHAIEAVVQRGRHYLEAARIGPDTAAAAIEAKQRAMGGVELTGAQQRAVAGITGSGHGVDLVIGVAGSGKTTALDAVRLAFEADGYTVIGTATSGQAARTLGRDANVASSTLASLLWRLDHNQARLDARTVVILDEVGMTDDPDLLRLLTAAENAGAKLVMVGDDRQLGAVGPGGGLRALADRHQRGVWVLDENVRQADPAERAALEQLRAGDAALAVDWMATRGRIGVGADRTDTIAAMVGAWAADVDAGYDSMMLAWRRTNVDALNRVARKLCDERGHLDGPEITAPGGRRYRAGDRIVTLAPGVNGQIVTSERGVVTAVNVIDRSLVAHMDDGRDQHFTVTEIGKDRMNHGYAITVHRSQGATVDTAHRLEDGGGRELAYVSMSRARDRSTVWVVADDVGQAAEDLKRDWPRENRQRWAIDSGTPSTEPQQVEHDQAADLAVRQALRQARLRAERDALTASIPADPVEDLHRNRNALVQQRQALADLAAGAGQWDGTEVGALAREINTTEQTRQRAVWRSNSRSASRSDIRAAKREIKHADALLDQIHPRYEQLAAPQRDQINRTMNDLENEETALKVRSYERRQWIADHPEVLRRLGHLDTELGVIDQALSVERDLLDGMARAVERPQRSLADDLFDSLPPATQRLQRQPPTPDLGLGLGL